MEKLAVILALLGAGFSLLVWTVNKFIFEPQDRREEVSERKEKKAVQTRLPEPMNSDKGEAEAA